MKNMSFIATKQQVRDKTKDITRRVGWCDLKPGDRVQACEKCQGRKKGEPLVKIHVIEVVSNDPEPMNALVTTYEHSAALDELLREGFPDMTPAAFVRLLRELNPKKPENHPINRIVFRYV